MVETRITTRDGANAVYVHLLGEGEGYRAGLLADGMGMSVEDAIDGMLDGWGARLRNDLCGDGLNVVQCTDGSLVGLRDDAGEGAWAIVIEVPS